ncbi:MAG: SIS domain-containing protein [Conexivisphaerales archaeon]
MSDSSAYRMLVNSVIDYSLPVDTEWLIERIKYSKRVITVGTGRSGDVAEVLMRFLRNLGIDYSYGPNDLPYILGSCDLTIAFSGSGSTYYTVEVARAAKRGSGFLASITSNVSSPLSALSDKTILIPGASLKESDHFANQITGISKVPLTPMGTLFELRSLLFSLSLVSQLRGFGISEAHKSLVEGILGFNPKAESYSDIYKLLPKASKGFEYKKIVIIGEGLSGIVGKFFATRLRHCSKPDEERHVSFWLDKGSVSIKKGDVIFIISGSGGGVTPNLAKRSREKGAKVVSLTSFKDSELASNSDYVMEIPGRIKMNLKGLRTSYYPQDPMYSIFELRTLFFLETLIYYLANADGITENDMRLMHSDFT